MSPARTAATLASAATVLAACAGTTVDTITGVRSMCDVPFEEGKIVQVSDSFIIDKLHGTVFYDPTCQGKAWLPDFGDPFESRYADALGLDELFFVRAYRIEVEGRLFINQDGKPGIEFLKLGKVVGLKEPD